MPLYAKKRPVPRDLQQLGKEYRDITRYTDFLALLQDGTPLSTDQLLKFVLRNTDIDITLRTIGLGFKPRVVTVPITGVEIIRPNRSPRGYIILNPAEISGITQQFTPFTSQVLAVGTTNSASFNVTGVETVRVFLDVTATGAGALTINAQTQDPLTANWVTAAADIFSGAVGVGTYYAMLGPLGVDRLIRMQAVVTTAAKTLSISGLLKGGLNSPVGMTVYLGPSSVNTTMGYPVLPGTKETFYLRENVSLWGITQTESLVLKVFELQ